MINLPTAEHFSYFFIGQILAFSLCFIVVERITRPVVIWLLSNLLTVIGYSMGPLQMLPSAHATWTLLSPHAHLDKPVVVLVPCTAALSLCCCRLCVLLYRRLCALCCCSS